MSKANATPRQSPQPQPSQTGAAQTQPGPAGQAATSADHPTEAAPGAADAAVVLAAQAQAVQTHQAGEPADAHPGQGGLYVLKDGKRVLLERTQLESGAATAT